MMNKRDKYAVCGIKYVDGDAFPHMVIHYRRTVEKARKIADNLRNAGYEVDTRVKTKSGHFVISAI